MLQLGEFFALFVR